MYIYIYICILFLTYMLKSCLFIYRFRVKKFNLFLLSRLQYLLPFFFTFRKYIVSYQKNIMCFILILLNKK